MKKLALICAVVVLFLAAAAPPPTASGVSGPAYGGTFVVGLFVEPSMLMGQTSTSAYTQAVAGQIYNKLVALKSNLDSNQTWLVPELAQSWSVSPDGLAITFNLVQNATWQDGVKFTSKDVQFTIMNVSKVNNPQGRSVYAAVQAIDTPDNYTAVFHLKSPQPDLLSYMGDWRVGTMIARHLYEGTDILKNPHNFDSPIGTGPFMFKEWVKGDHITLVKNPNYWKAGQPYLDTVVFRIIKDAAGMAAALRTGEIDYVAMDFPPSQVDTLSGANGVQIGKFMYLYQAYTDLAFNLDNPILKDVRIRRALNFAVDRERICNLTGFGFYEPLYGHLTYYVAPNVKYMYDPAHANALLDEAGYKKGADGYRGLQFTLTYSVDRNVEDVMQLLKDMWGAVGVKITLEGLADAAWIDKTFVKRTFEISLNQWSPGPVPSVVRKEWYSTQVGKGGWTNAFNYTNPVVDQLLDKAASELNPVMRKQMYAQIQDTINQDAIGVELYKSYYPAPFNVEFVGLPSGTSLRDSYENVWWVKGTPATPVATTEATTTSQPETSSGISTNLLITLAAVVIIIAVAATLVMKARKPKPTTP